jgi:hypothetical protein
MDEHGPERADFGRDMNARHSEANLTGARLAGALFV